MSLRINLDCDEVLLDLMSDTLATLRDTSHYRDIVPSIDVITQFNLANVFDPRLNDDRLKLWSKPEFWHQLTPVAGAVDAVRDMRSMGWDITVVTSPYLDCPDWDRVRRMRLNELFDIDADDVIVASKKHMVTADVFVDDRSSKVIEWQNANHDGLGVVRARPWSGTYLAQSTMHSWGDLFYMCGQHVKIGGAA